MRRFSKDSQLSLNLLPHWTVCSPSGAAPTARTYHSATLIGKNALWIHGGHGLPRSAGDEESTDEAEMQAQELEDLYLVKVVDQEHADDDSDDGLDDVSSVGSKGSKDKESGGRESRIRVKCRLVRDLQPLEARFPRMGHTATLIEPGPFIYYFGGWGGRDYLKHGMLLDVNKKQFLVEKTKGRRCPEARRDHTLTRVGRRLFLFGGWSIENMFGDLWIVDKYQWKWRKAEVSGVVPLARRGHSATRIGRRIWVFGGVMGICTYLNDVHVFNVDTLEWSKPEIAGVPPSRRAWHSACAVGKTGQILFFGGTAGRTNFYSDLYVLDTEQLEWFRLHPASTNILGRCSHTATMINDKMVVFGGLVASPSDDMIFPTDEWLVLHTGLDLETAMDEDEEENEGGDEAHPTEAEREESAMKGVPAGPTPTGEGTTASEVIIDTMAAAGTHGKEKEKNKPEKEAGDQPNQRQIGGNSFVRGDLLDELESSRNAPIEGWLTMSVPAHGRSSIIRGANSTRNLAAEVWRRRFFRLNEKEGRLMLWDYKEKGHMVVANGIVRLWRDKFVPWLVDPNTVTIEGIIADPESAAAAHFLTFTKSIFSQENAMFALRVAQYKRITDGGEEQLASARSIVSEFMESMAPSQIDVRPSILEEVQQSIASEHVSSRLFDEALKAVESILRLEILPQYQRHLQQLRGSFSLKTALTEQEKTAPACENCLARFGIGRRRNFCRSCGEILCSSCVTKEVTLPSFCNVPEPTYVCDYCDFLLRGDKSFTFTLATEARRRPLNIMADSEDSMMQWVHALNQSLAISAANPELSAAFRAIAEHNEAMEQAAASAGGAEGKCENLRAPIGVVGKTDSHQSIASVASTTSESANNARGGQTPTTASPILLGSSISSGGASLLPTGNATRQASSTLPSASSFRGSPGEDSILAQTPKSGIAARTFSDGFDTAAIAAAAAAASTMSGVGAEGSAGSAPLHGASTEAVRRNLARLPPPPSGAHHLEGWLKKEDPNHARDWRPRYFVLHQNNLSYYQLFARIEETLEIAHETDIYGDSYEELTLSHGVAAVAENGDDGADGSLRGGFTPGSQFSYRFNVTNGSTRTIQLAADSEEDRIRWCDAIQRLITLAQRTILKAASGADATAASGHARQNTNSVRSGASLSRVGALELSSQSLEDLTTAADDDAGLMEEKEQKNVAFVVASISNYAVAWNNAPEAAMEEMQTTQMIMNRISNQYGGEPAASSTESFSFAFSGVSDAILWCIDVQRNLLRHSWREELLRLPEFMPDVDTSGQRIFAGFRVRMGLHTGTVGLKRSLLLGRMEYTGVVVDVASTLAQYACGGQILCTQAVRDRLIAAQSRASSARALRASLLSGTESGATEFDEDDEESDEESNEGEDDEESRNEAAAGAPNRGAGGDSDERKKDHLRHKSHAVGGKRSRRVGAARHSAGAAALGASTPGALSSTLGGINRDTNAPGSSSSLNHGIVSEEESYNDGDDYDPLRLANLLSLKGVTSKQVGVLEHVTAEAPLIIFELVVPGLSTRVFPRVRLSEPPPWAPSTSMAPSLNPWDEPPPPPPPTE